MLVDLINVLGENYIPHFVAGRMSNVLIRNGRYDGVLIITTKIKGKSRAENLVTLSCGEILTPAILSLAYEDLGGLEGLSGIPGTVGGMVRQNAGAFGYEVKDRFKEALCYVRSVSEIRRFEKDDMRFSYRDSILAGGNAILLCATFDLLRKKREDILSEINRYREHRLSTQPTDHPSLGSVFMRYNGVSAGYYIDRAGLKGAFLGGARVSEKHAGFIINTGGATADDYLGLINFVKDRVYSVFGVELEEEIQII